jgi:hypothetical protein
MAEILNSYLDTTRKDDVLSLVEILTAKENYFLNNLGKNSAKETTHQTMTDTLRTAASGAVTESADYTNLARTTPTLVPNVVQIVAIPFRVSKTQQQIQHYHEQNELSRQTTKALMDWGNAAEFDLVRSTLVSGASGTAPKMNGIIRGISKSSNYTLQTSGTVFSASILRGLMKDQWDNSNGDVATDIFVGSYLSNAIDEFTNKSYTVIDGSNEKSIVHSVDIFETGLGKVRKHNHRYIQSSDANGRILGVRPEKLKIAYLQKPFIDTGLARSGDYDSRAVVGKFTLETINKDSNFFADGYNIG